MSVLPVSSLRRGHADLLCIVPILVYVLPKRALPYQFRISFSAPSCHVEVDRFSSSYFMCLAYDSVGQYLFLGLARWFCGSHLVSLRIYGQLMADGFIQVSAG